VTMPFLVPSGFSDYVSHEGERPEMAITLAAAAGDPGSFYPQLAVAVEGVQNSGSSAASQPVREE